MSAFSELLTTYVDGRNVNVSALAQYCGLDRSSFYKFKRGERVTNNKKLIEKIAEFIHLTPDETDELMRARTIESVGENVFYTREHIHRFLANFPFEEESQNGILKLHSQELDREDSGVRFISRKSEVEMSVISAFMHEMKQERGRIDLLLPPTQEVMHLLSYVDQTVENLTIRHVLSLDSENRQRKSDHVNYNLFCIQKILPLYTYSFHYEGFYYYGSMMENQESFRLFPYMLLTSRGAILMSSNLEQGIRIMDRDAVVGLRDIFETYLSKAHPIARCIEDPLELLQNVGRNVTIPSQRSFSFQMIPCVTPFLTQEMFMKYLNAEFFRDPTVLNPFLQHVALLGKAFKNAQFIEMFSLDGLRYFIEHGRVTEYPKDIYNPLERKDCIRLIRKS